MWRPLRYRFASKLSGKGLWQIFCNSFQNEQEFDYITEKIRNADPGSKFEKHVRYIKWLPGFVLVWLLLSESFEGILFYDDDLLIGHVFWHKRSTTDWRMFSIGVKKEYEGKNYGRDITRIYLSLAAAKGIHYIRFGAGGTEAEKRYGGEDFALKMWAEATSVKNPLQLPFSIERGALVGEMLLTGKRIENLS